jgi:F0F1-type ATP synthase beta subunit
MKKCQRETRAWWRFLRGLQKSVAASKKGEKFTVPVGASMNKNIITPTYCIEYISASHTSHVTRHQHPTKKRQRRGTNHDDKKSITAQCIVIHFLIKPLQTGLALSLSILL